MIKKDIKEWETKINNKLYIIKTIRTTEEGKDRDDHKLEIGHDGFYTLFSLSFDEYIEIRENIKAFILGFEASQKYIFNNKD